jgi:hypothetical protein
MIDWQMVSMLSLDDGCPFMVYMDGLFVAGLFLSDIAEVRSGVGSFGFKVGTMFSPLARSRGLMLACCLQVHGTEGLNPELCLSIVGSERTLEFQLKDAGAMARTSFVDTLRLLILKSLTYEETTARNLRWQRETLVEVARRKGRPVWTRPMSAKRVRDANMMMTLLSNSIQVEEEIYTPDAGLQIVSRQLKYEIDENTFYITSVDETSSIDATNGNGEIVIKRPSSCRVRCPK